MSPMELQELADELNGVKESLSPQSLGIKTWLKPKDKDDADLKIKVLKKQPEMPPNN